jgi:hypothetical protein
MLIPILLAVQIASSPQSGTPQPLLSVSTPILLSSVDGPSKAEFRLTNRADQAVTAWKVGITLHLADGTTDETNLLVDAYLVYAGLGDARDDAAIVPAHGSTQWSTYLSPLRPVGIDSVDIRLIAAIYADRTALGDLGHTEDMFRARDRDCRAMADVIDALRVALLKANGDDALRLALERLNSSQQSDYEHLDKRAMRRNLQLALNKHPSIKVSAGDFLREWALTMEARWQAANTHRQPNLGNSPK